MEDPLNDYPTQPGPEPCPHNWRVVNCRADGVDELECAICHETKRCACTFDEEVCLHLRRGLLMSELDLKAIDARAKAATPGPWIAAGLGWDIAERTETRAEAYRETERANALAKRVEELQVEVERGKNLIERDRTGMAAALNEIRKVAIGYGWIPAGELGSYTAAGCGEGEELTEEVLRAEVGRCLDVIRGLAARALAASGDCVNEMFAERRAGRK